MIHITKVYFSFTNELQNEELFDKLYRTVPYERQKKVDRLICEEDKRLSLGAACLLKQALAEVGANCAEVGRDSYGKPYLVDCKNIFFNLSHSKDMVLCALSPQEVGCDVEKVGDMRQSVARRYFSPDEYNEIIKADNPKEQKLLFYRMWTLKESFIKAKGQGLQMSLDSFQVRLLGDEIKLSQNGKDLPYYFKEYEPVEGYRCAVCSRIPEFGELKQISLQ